MLCATVSSLSRWKNRRICRGVSTLMCHRLGITTHGHGIEGALEAARDLIHLWVNEKRAGGENPVPARESLLATVEVD